MYSFTALLVVAMKEKAKHTVFQGADTTCYIVQHVILRGKKEHFEMPH
jgi:hypothetical protein